MKIKVIELFKSIDVRVVQSISSNLIWENVLWLAFWNKSQDSFFKRMISIVYCLSLSFSANRKVCSYAYTGRTMTASVFHFAKIYQTTQVFYGCSGFLRQKRWDYEDKSHYSLGKVWEAISFKLPNQYLYSYANLI